MVGVCLFPVVAVVMEVAQLLPWRLLLRMWKPSELLWMQISDVDVETGITF